MLKTCISVLRSESLREPFLILFLIRRLPTEIGRNVRMSQRTAEKPKI